MLMSVWDDGYGISVPKKYQTVKESISTALSGFQREEASNGLVIYRVKGWDYPNLVATYEDAAKRCREDHVPVLVHVEEVTQPQGHSTSGIARAVQDGRTSGVGAEYDCIRQMAEFLVKEGAATQEELDALRKEAKKDVRAQQKEAWASFRAALDEERMSAADLLAPLDASRAEALRGNGDAGRAEVAQAVRRTLADTAGETRPSAWRWAVGWKRSTVTTTSATAAPSTATSPTARCAWRPSRPPTTPSRNNSTAAKSLQRNFEAMFSRDPRVLTFGEDTGGIGGVNQVMEGMQEKFGEVRVSDTGIRECTILGQGIGMAMRGLRPIAEIQYLDYLYYALQIMRDDLASVRYRTAGGQKAPLIVRTRGHRLEGIWHSGSPMGAIIHSIRGMHVCVPRNMTQAAGMYNTLLEAEEPALVVECLNGYRKKEPLPNNIGAFRVPLGVTETLREGDDLTMLSYGSTLHLAEEACQRLAELGIEVELIDAQTLLPFDLRRRCGEVGGEDQSIVGRGRRRVWRGIGLPAGRGVEPSRRVALLGWTSQDAGLQTPPPAYGSDGDYFSKPSVEDIVETAYNVLREVDRPVTHPCADVRFHLSDSHGIHRPASVFESHGHRSHRGRGQNVGRRRIHPRSTARTKAVAEESCVQATAWTSRWTPQSRGGLWRKRADFHTT